MDKKTYFLGLTVILLFCLLGYFMFVNNPTKKSKEKPSAPEPVVKTTFTYNLINTSVENNNYLISPLSIKYALNMLKEGAKGETLTQIEEALGHEQITKVLSTKDRFGISNAIFIKNLYKNDINNNFIDILKQKYNSEVLFDDFKTPNVINNWVKEKTFDMIPSLLNNIDSEFILGITNAVAIDVDWNKQFDCMNTKSEKFTKIDNTEINVVMMHEIDKTEDLSYIQGSNEVGIIKKYKMYNKISGQETYEKDDNLELEFIAIMPNSNIEEYINTFTASNLNQLVKNSRVSNKELEIRLSMPRFSYEYKMKDFTSNLESLGIKNVFDKEKSDLGNMVNEKSILKLYVDTAIHKTKIDLNEKGTKAAAVTYFGIETTAIEEKQPKRIEINFNKPFIYIIREIDSNDIMFFGTVYEPMLWTDTTVTCEIN